MYLHPQELDRILTTSIYSQSVPPEASTLHQPLDLRQTGSGLPYSRQSGYSFLDGPFLLRKCAYIRSDSNHLISAVDPRNLRPPVVLVLEQEDS
ncbi:unnamed protein product [Calypogeia fissa]